LRERTGDQLLPLSDFWRPGRDAAFSRGNAGAGPVDARRLLFRGNRDADVSGDAAVEGLGAGEERRTRRRLPGRAPLLPGAAIHGRRSLRAPAPAAATLAQLGRRRSTARVPRYRGQAPKKGRPRSHVGIHRDAAAIGQHTGRRASGGLNQSRTERADCRSPAAMSYTLSYTMYGHPRMFSAVLP